MQNEQFPAPDPNSRVEAYGGMQTNPLEGHGVPGVEVERVTDNSGLIEVPGHLKPAGSVTQSGNEIVADKAVPVKKREPLFTIGPDDPRYAKRMAKHLDDQDKIRAAAHDADVRGTRL